MKPTTKKGGKKPPKYPKNKCGGRKGGCLVEYIDVPDLVTPVKAAA